MTGDDATTRMGAAHFLSGPKTTCARPAIEAFMVELAQAVHWEPNDNRRTVCYGGLIVELARIVVGIGTMAVAEHHSLPVLLINVLASIQVPRVL